MVALLMERPFWDSDNLPMITLYCENAAMLVLLVLRFNATLTGQCCFGGPSGVLLPLMDSIAGATAGGECRIVLVAAQVQANMLPTQKQGIVRKNLQFQSMARQRGVEARFAPIYRWINIKFWVAKKNHLSRKQIGRTPKYVHYLKSIR